MEKIKRIKIIGSREGSRKRRRIKEKKKGKKFRVGIKRNIRKKRKKMIRGVERCINMNEMKKKKIKRIKSKNIKI